MGAVKMGLVPAILLYVMVVGLVPQPSVGLVPEPRIDEQASSKYPSLKQYNFVNEPANSPQSKGPDAGPHEESFEDENRITISEPYKTLIQTTTRFVLVQSSLTDYVSVDTFMDAVGGVSYALSKPSNLGVALKTVVVAILAVLTGAFIVPATLIQSLAAIVKNPQNLMKLEKHLPGGLNEMGIISLLNEKTEDLLTKLRLNDSSCREQTICRTGELARCTFPKASKVAINFISENFSRPKYRSNKYLNAFLTGFIDQNCPFESPDSDNNSAQSKSCASNFIKSLSFCSSNSASSTAPPASPKSNFQSIRTPRAQK